MSDFFPGDGGGGTERNASRVATAQITFLNTVVGLVPRHIAERSTPRAAMHPLPDYSQ